MIDDLLLAPPEIMVDPPHAKNDWKWVWGVYQPDACWGTIASGSCWKKEEAEALARQAYNIEMMRRGHYDLLELMGEPYYEYQ